jgi:hypothetical protein
VTDIAIQPLTVANQADLNRCDNSFTVEAELHLTAEDGCIGCTVEPMTPYVKRYGVAVQTMPEAPCSVMLTARS